VDVEATDVCLYGHFLNPPFTKGLLYF
jgi:hypothetical protein